MPTMSPAERLRQGRHVLFRMLHPRRDLVVIRLKGDLDAARVEQTTRVLRRVLRNRPRALEVDLSGVTCLTAEGALPLFFAARGARGQGIRFGITHADPQAEAVMHRLGLERYLANGTPG
ncbi:STAS domain-containing protein [Streptomyces sp. NPDC015232]|uniref:STAS domain-containing protein n=1 Tax=unclassified Streptomyces TaxID=2593676 RepID=UPI00370201D7